MHQHINRDLKNKAVKT